MPIPSVSRFLPVGYLLLLIGVWQCQQAPTEDELLRKEEELQKLFLQQNQQVDKAIQSKAEALIKDFEAFARANPKKEVEYLLKAAGLYQSVLGQPQKAILLYERIATEHKGNPGADRALFMMGYLYHNEMNDTAMARKYYEALLSEYPNSPFVTHAKQELQYLGIPLEELAEKYLQSAPALPDSMRSPMP